MLNKIFNHLIKYFQKLEIDKQLLLLKPYKQTIRDKQMYIPKYYLTENRTEILAFMRKYSFATIVSATDNKPVASHLPFVVEEVGEDIMLHAHFSKANEQWKQISNNEVLVIFTEPHAYISPTHYDSYQSVPTWNYLSVHAYGKAEIITDSEKGFRDLEQMINIHEQSYLAQWKSLPDEYKKAMYNGIVPFQIKVTDLQAKKKLSQNKKEAERERIISTLEKSADTNEQQIAAYMKQHESK